jgi:uncharacterized protein (TIGR03435 family)
MRAASWLAAGAVVVTLAGVEGSLQSPKVPPVFEVVSIRRNNLQPGSRPAPSSVQQRPDGGITLINFTVSALIARAYPASGPRQTVNLPEWANRELYDVRATASLTSVTADDRIAMLRAMLADRFKLAVHFEQREQPSYDLVVARRDGTLGRGLTKVDLQCPHDRPTNVTDSPLPLDLKSPPPPCTLRIVGRNPIEADRDGDPSELLEGEATMTTLAQTLRLPARRFVTDKTGLVGTYRVEMRFDMVATLSAPAATPSQTGGRISVFDAVERQLGLKLESSRSPGEALVIDNIERPTEN